MHEPKGHWFDRAQFYRERNDSLDDVVAALRAERDAETRRADDNDDARKQAEAERVEWKWQANTAIKENARLVSENTDLRAEREDALRTSIEYQRLFNSTTTRAERAEGELEAVRRDRDQLREQCQRDHEHAKRAEAEVERMRGAVRASSQRDECFHGVWIEDECLECRAASSEPPCEGCPDPGLPCLGCPASSEQEGDNAYANHRGLGGLLTNWKMISDRLKWMERCRAALSKQEARRASIDEARTAFANGPEAAAQYLIGEAESNSPTVTPASPTCECKPTMDGRIVHDCKESTDA